LALLLVGAPAALAGGSGGALGFSPMHELELRALGGAAGDVFGISVALSGGVTLAGAPGRTVGGNAAQGAAIVFWHSGELDQQVTLTASDGATDDGFGYFVALDGDTAVVGAPGADVGGVENMGAVYVFVRTGGAWVQQAKLTPPDGQAKDGFGMPVAIDGDTLVASAPEFNVDGRTGQGVVYVFTRTGGVWSAPVKLTASDGAEDDVFGYSASISGDTLVSGAPGRDVGGNQSQGTEYVFVRSGGTWSQQAELTISDGSAGDAFGWSCDVDGDTLLVGAAGVAGVRGSASVFARSGATWTRQVELRATGGHAGAMFGSSCAVSGDLFVVGSRLQTVGTNVAQGAAFVFRHVGDSWDPLELTASDGAAGDQFGWWVDAEDETVAVGAPMHAVDGAAAQGAAYLYTPLVGPGVKVSRPGGGWHQRPVKLTFSAVPAENGAPVRATQYWIEGVSHLWTDAKSLRITAQGVTRVQVRAVDVNGTPGDVRRVTVRVDSRRPHVVAGPAVASGGLVSRLSYSVTDPMPGCGHALVRLVVSDARGKVLTRASTLPVTTNARHTIRVRTGGLAPGVYHVSWRAVDAAGNFQRGITVTTLTVR
jgi:hypothetical protein